jgi:methylmalonyl-CoA/ethylmalonyl-CoA epimerase
MTSVAPVGITQIGQISVITHDLPRAVAFYRDVLELPFLFQAANLAFFDCGGVRLMLSPPDAPERDHPASLIYYKVNDIDAAHVTLLRRGVAFLDPPHLVAKMPDHEVWMAFFYDVDGNTLALMSERPLT